MTDILIILYQYTEIIVGRRKNYSDIFPDVRTKEDTAARFIRLACKVYLGCETYSAALSSITPELIERMKLQKIFDMIKVPSAVRKEDRWNYCMARIFIPNFNQEEWINDLYYQKMISGETFPRTYFSGQKGKERLAYFMWLILKNEHPTFCAEDAYHFAGTKDFTDTLEKYNLKRSFERIYKGETAFHLIHDALPEEMQDETILKREVANAECGDDWF